MPAITISDDDLSLGAGTTAREVAAAQPGADAVLVCRINGELRDLSARVRSGDAVEFLTFDDSEARRVFWHSAAHVLGYAITRLHPGALLAAGPPTETGFFYDVRLAAPLTQAQCAAIEAEALAIAAQDLPFERETRTRAELLDAYRGNPYKTHFVRTKTGEEAAVYRVGAFVDLCAGPHIASTGRIGAFKVTKSGSAYFLGDAANDALQRVSGTAFPTADGLRAFLAAQEAAQQRDHRRLGAELGLFFFHPYAPGAAFFLPEGAAVYNGLVDFLRGEYARRGFREVITPNVFSLDLWRESGHLDNYREHMFLVGDDAGLKPMNCPAHCLIFRHAERTYRELPLRLADFGVLHRNELSGALSGLTRVRRFQQDDAHIFCAPEQVEREIEGCLAFLEHVYAALGFGFELLLSTRPARFLGDVREWARAEDALRGALGKRPHRVNEGDGAFYGPKIDIVVLDALQRRHQCATIQLDFQLPQRFGLRFRRSDGRYDVPVIIHRAMLGSVERMVAILLEHHGKRLPLWLSPRQVALVPVGAAARAYADEVAQRLAAFRVRVLDDEGLSFNKRIRNAQVGGFCVVAVVGEREAREGTVSVRADNASTRWSVDELVAQLRRCVEGREAGLRPAQVQAPGPE